VRTVVVRRIVVRTVVARIIGVRKIVVRTIMTQADPIYDLLARARNIAVVGLSDIPMRASHGVSAYMQMQGYRIIPVNPKIAEALGEKSYPSLLDTPLDVAEKIDLVDVFRRPEFVDEIVEQAIQLKIPAIWLQEGVINERAAEKARRAGIFVVMDLCVLKEHRARFR
jgi:predicted CoA-binding protein